LIVDAQRSCYVELSSRQKKVAMPKHPTSSEPTVGS